MALWGAMCLGWHWQCPGEPLLFPVAHGTRRQQQPQCCHAVPGASTRELASVLHPGVGTRDSAAGQGGDPRGCGGGWGRRPPRARSCASHRALHVPVNFTPSALDRSLVIFGEPRHKFVPPHCSKLLSGDGRAPLPSTAGARAPWPHQGHGTGAVLQLQPLWQGVTCFGRAMTLLRGCECAQPCSTISSPQGCHAVLSVGLGIPLSPLQCPLAHGGLSPSFSPSLSPARSHRSPSLFQAMRSRRIRR